MSINKKYVKYYLSLSLKELRRRQRLAELQTRSAYAVQNTKGLNNLQDVSDSLAEAVNQKEFN